MVKIKTKKQLNLPQLLEWAWDNPKSSRNKRFVSENKEFPYVNQYVIFNEVGYAEIENSYCYGRNDLFTVEVEEEITEDTRLEHTIEIYKVDNIEWVRSIEHNNMSISKMKDRGNIASLAFYILNDEYDTLTLIGKMESWWSR